MFWLGRLVHPQQLVRSYVILKELVYEREERGVLGWRLLDHDLIRCEVMTVVWHSVAFDHGLESETEHLPIATEQIVSVFRAGLLDMARDVLTQLLECALVVIFGPVLECLAGCQRIISQDIHSIGRVIVDVFAGK